VQYKLLTRVELRLVDTFPCLGGATVTLLDVPHIDYKLRLMVEGRGLGVWGGGGRRCALCGRGAARGACRHATPTPTNTFAPASTPPPRPQGGIDMMALPGVNDAVRFIVQVRRAPPTRRRRRPAAAPLARP
jgi:hypothetical protein